MKKIFFALLSFSSLSYAMDLSILRKNTIKKIITYCAEDLNTGSANIAKQYANQGKNIQKMSDKLDRLFAIAEDPKQEFTKDDLKDEWYLNATKVITTQFNRRSIQHMPYTLLSLAMKDEDNLQIKKIKTLIKAGINCKENINNELLPIIALKKNRTNDPIKKYNYCKIARLLLKHKANPNYQSTFYDEKEKRLYTSPTALMLAACYEDKVYMDLLLSHHAHYYHPTIAQQYKNNEGFWYDSFGFDPKKILNIKTGEPIGLLRQVLLDRQLT